MNETLLRDIPQLAPLDEHNRVLADHVHPTAWVNPTPAGRYNLVVIGAGTAGLVTAAGAAGLGAKVALIERALMGGDCLNVGCVPSKALLRCARARADVERSAEFGVRLSGAARVDFPAVMERMRRLRARISPNDSAARFRDLGVDVYIGAGRFTGPGTVEVEGARLSYARACIATGARAALLPIPGLGASGCLTNESVFSLTELPPRLAVIGAGPIGCEMAQAFARFGSKVTLLEVADRILIREDRDAAEIVDRSLRRDGVDVRTGVRITSVGRSGAERVVEIEGGSPVTIDEVLLGVGRAANVEGLGLDAVGVQTHAGGIVVDDRLRTTARGVFAAGDVCSPYKFTHAADFMARIVIQNALFFGRSRASALVIPWCTYTDPEIAHVGLSESLAAERGIEIDTYAHAMEEVDRAILDGEDEGFLKVHTKRGSDKILGATIVARHAGDLIAQVTQAMVGGVGLGTIARTIHPYPVQADVFRRTADAYNRTRLTPRVKRIFEAILRWRR